MDQAAVLRELKVNLGLPWTAIGKKLGLTKRRVLDLVGLLDLPDEIKEDIRQKKLTERHGRALRQLLDKAEILRDVFKFIKDKNLIGEQTQELVQVIKSEPRFIIEESYNNLYLSKRATSSKSLKTDTLGKITAINKSLINTFNSIEKESLTSEEFKKVEFDLKKLIESINNFLKKFKTETNQ